MLTALGVGSLVIGLALDGTLSIEGDVIAPDSLAGQLKRHKLANGKVAIKPDARLAAAELLSLSQLLREAGFTQIWDVYEELAALSA